MQIYAKAICLFRRNDSILVSCAFDKVKNELYYRPMGGHINFGETAKDAVVREIKEELGQDIENIRLIDTVENIFTCDGIPGHEYIVIFDAEFKDKEFYQRDNIIPFETGWIRSEWKQISDFRNGDILYPDGLINILEKM